MIVWQQNGIDGYYDFEGTDWLEPAALRARPHERVRTGASTCSSTTASHIHVIGWREGNVLYWVTNTLLEELSNEQMLAIVGEKPPQTPSLSDRASG